MISAWNTAMADAGRSMFGLPAVFSRVTKAMEALREALSPEPEECQTAEVRYVSSSDSASTGDEIA